MMGYRYNHYFYYDNRMENFLLLGVFFSMACVALSLVWGLVWATPYMLTLVVIFAFLLVIYMLFFD